MSHRINASRASDMAMRVTLRGSEPMRLDATSAKSAVMVQEHATPSEMISPVYVRMMF